MRVKNGEDYREVIEYCRQVLCESLNEVDGGETRVLLLPLSSSRESNSSLRSLSLGFINDFCRFYIELDVLSTCNRGMQFLSSGDSTGGEIVMKCLLKKPAKFTEHWGLLIDMWRGLAGIWGERYEAAVCSC